MQKAQSTAAGDGLPLTSLSGREWEVFRLLGSGYGPSHIAGTLQVSVKTVEGYLARIQKKLHLHGTRQLRPYAIRCNQSGATAVLPAAPRELRAFPFRPRTRRHKPSAA